MRPARHSHRAGLLALLLVAGCNTTTSQLASRPLVPPTPTGTAPPIWGFLPIGPWDVGLRVLPVPPGPDAADAHPVQLTVWYPSRTAAFEPHLRYRDYVGLSGSEQRPEAWNDAALCAAAATGYHRLLTEELKLPEQAVSAWLDAEVSAVREATPAPGRFPLVLIAQGRFHSAHHQALLAEDLASHGYVVATTPFPKHLAPPSPDEDVLATARGQARELARALAVMEKDPGVEASRVALVGHSFGARAAFLFALERPETSALVSLDGGIANRMGREWLDGLSGFRPEDFHTPLLHLYQEGDAAVVPDFDLVQSLRGADRWLVRVAGMRHLDFTSVGAATTVAHGLAPTGAEGAAARG
ncbi:dienelactone hydrolase family protein, partial [Pyxidicoccus sp. 3LG]